MFGDGFLTITKHNFFTVYFTSDLRIEKFINYSTFSYSNHILPLSLHCNVMVYLVFRI